MDGVKIFEQILKKDKNGNTISKFAILRCLDIDLLNESLVKYVKGVPMNIFVEIRLTDPWTRVIISRINELKFRTNDMIEREKKLKKINEISNGIQ